LVKSAIPAKLARGPVVGLDRQSARERLSARFYDRAFSVDKSMHAIERVRRLFAFSLDYEYPETPPSVQLNLSQDQTAKKGILFFHGTTWPSKHWPDDSWLALGRALKQKGEDIYLPWSTDTEKARAEWLSQNLAVPLMPRLTLTELAGLMLNVKAVVGVDTGLTHLAALLDVSSIGIYGSTDVGLTGAVGIDHKNLNSNFECSPCLKRNCNLLDSKTTSPPCYEVISPDAVLKGIGMANG